MNPPDKPSRQTRLRAVLAFAATAFPLSVSFGQPPCPPECIPVWAVVHDLGVGNFLNAMVTCEDRASAHR